MRVECPALGEHRRNALVKSISILWGSFRDVTGPRSQSGELENREQFRLVLCGDLGLSVKLARPFLQMLYVARGHQMFLQRCQA